jgi:hypothetical protein
MAIRSTEDTAAVQIALSLHIAPRLPGFALSPRSGRFTTAVGLAISSCTWFTKASPVSGGASFVAADSSPFLLPSTNFRKTGYGYAFVESRECSDLLMELSRTETLDGTFIFSQLRPHLSSVGKLPIGSGSGSGVSFRGFPGEFLVDTRLKRS